MAESLFLAKEVFTHMEVRCGGRCVGYACGAEGASGARDWHGFYGFYMRKDPQISQPWRLGRIALEIGTRRPPHHSAGHDDGGHAAFREFAVSATIAAFLLIRIRETYISFCGAPPQLLQFLPSVCVAWSDGIA